MTPGNLIALGAGNCDDLDLPALGRLFQKITLVDLDRDAILSACHEQLQTDGQRLPESLECVAPLDIAEPLTSLRSDEFSNAAFAAHCAELLSASKPSSVRPAHVVVSCCMLSQLIDTLSRKVSPTSTHFLPLVQAVRQGHLQRMTDLLLPNGVGILATDFVSSDTLPALQTVSPSDLPALIRQCLESRNFFTGLHPAALLNVLHTASPLRESIESVRVSEPWRWNPGPRSYAVFAIRFTKRSHSSPN